MKRNSVLADGIGAVAAVGFLLSFSVASAQTAQPAPKAEPEFTPVNAQDTVADAGPLRFVAADLENGVGVFLDPSSIDRSQPGAVRLKTVEVYRSGRFHAGVRYERSEQTVDCSGTAAPFLRKLNWIRAAETGQVLEKKLRPGHIREAVPYTTDQKLWQQVCQGNAPADKSDAQLVTGVAGAIAFYDPLQETADDTRFNGGAPAADGDPGHALYTATRLREREARSVNDLYPIVDDYTRAADLGSRQAMWRLVWANVAMNAEPGVVGWLRKLNDKGDARAQLALARYLMKSSSCDEARGYVQKAAESGLEDAQALLGLMLDKGQCGGTDPAQAAIWFEKAARQGHFYAQLMLGRLYETGSGVKASVTEAGAWYLVAAGHSPWEEGIDQYAAELDLAHLRAATPALIPGMGNYRDRARELCRQDNVCKLVVSKDVGELARMPRTAFYK